MFIIDIVEDCVFIVDDWNNHDLFAAVAPSVGLTPDQVASPVLLAGVDLRLSVNINFNGPLTAVSWEQGGTTLTDGEGGVTITNTPTLPAMSGPVTSSLLLSAVMPADANTYTITVTNAAGNTAFMFTVTVEG